MLPGRTYLRQTAEQAGIVALLEPYRYERVYVLDLLQMMTVVLGNNMFRKKALSSIAIRHRFWPQKRCWLTLQEFKISGEQDEVVEKCGCFICVSPRKLAVYLASVIL